MKFTQWIHENIWMDNGVYNIAPRHVAMKIFLQQGLVPLIKKAGYVFYYNEEILLHKLLTITHLTYMNKKFICTKLQEPVAREHFDLYNHKLDTDCWNTFWRRWGDLQDFNMDSRYGLKLRGELPYFLWHWLDLEHSPTFLKLEDEMYFEDNGYQHHDEPYNPRNGRDDPYLQDLRSGNIASDKYR